jgi:hypothetical protein
MTRKRMLVCVLAAASLAGCGAENETNRPRVALTAAPATNDTVTPAETTSRVPARKPDTESRIGRVVEGTYGTKRAVRNVPAQPVPPSVMAAARAQHVQRPAARTVRAPRSRAAAYRRAQMPALEAFCATAPPDPRCIGTRVNERVAFPKENAR